MNHRSVARRSIVVLGVLCVASFAATQKPAKLMFDGKSWFDHVKVIADDSMEGRETGSLGLRKAEAYVVEQLKSAGLEPAGTNGYYQPVRFESRELVEAESSI